MKEVPGRGKQTIEVQNEDDHRGDSPEGSRDTNFSDDSIDGEYDNKKGVGHTHHNKGGEDVEGIDYNIMYGSKASDLSSHHTNSLKMKKEKTTIPLQVRTRSYKRGTTGYNQL